MKASQVAFVAAAAILSLGAGRDREDSGAKSTAPTGLILQAEEGERLVRRQYGYSLVLKVDPVNGRSQHMLVGTEEVPPGKAIPLHKHPHADELLVIQQGAATAILGEQRRPVSAGATIFAPEGEWVGLENTGSETVRVMSVFSAPGFDQYLRATSVPEGQDVKPFTPQELAGIRERYKEHITFKDS